MAVLSGATYDNSITGLVVIDPYNDFVSAGGSITGMIRNDGVSLRVTELTFERSNR